MINHYNIIDDIVKKFGDGNKVELRMMLNELVDHEFEILTIKENMSEKNALLNQTHIITFDIMKLCSSDYDKCMRIINRLVRGKWYNLLIIPDKLRIEFFSQAEVNHEIEFKMEGDNEFFKIVDS